MIRSRHLFIEPQDRAENGNMDIVDTKKSNFVERMKLERIELRQKFPNMQTL